MFKDVLTLCQCSCVPYLVVLNCLIVVVTELYNTYVVRCFNFVSMLLCLIHSLVNAEPISLVAPEKYK